MAVYSRDSTHVSEFLQDRHPYHPEQFLHFFTSKPDPHEVKEAFGHRCITKLVDLLAFDELDPSNKAYALELLESMVSTQELKAEAQEAGAISCCVSLLQHDSQEVRRNASSLLGQLCLTRSGQLEMISTGGIRILTNLLQDNSIEVRESVARALCLLSISNEAANELVTEGIVPNLVQALDESRSPNEYIGINVINAIENCARSFQGCEMALAAEATPKCLRILRDMGENDDCLFACLCLLWELGNHATGKTDAVNCGAIQFVCPSLSHSSKDIRRVAVGVIMSLSINEAAKSIISNHCTADLCRLLRDEDNETQHNATLAIRQTSELPSAKRIFVENLVDDIELLVHVFKISSVEDLNDLLQTQDKQKLRQVIKAVSHICSTTKGAHSFANCLYAVDRLVAIMTNLEDNDINVDMLRDAAKSLASIVQVNRFCKRILRDILRHPGKSGLRRILRSFPETAAILPLLD